jgi:general secretion pathway protein D
MKRDQLFWLEVAAALGSLIGGAGLIALIAHDVRAADPARPGFNQGSKTFTNPFANTPGAPNAGDQGAAAGGFFDDEDGEENFQGSPGGGFPPPDSAGGGPAGGGPGAGAGGAGGPGRGAVQVGGGPPSGVISNSSVPPISIDDETGGGSREVVTDFNFPDADIMDIAKALGKLTGKNFILDKDVKGRVTVISNSPITVGDAWRAFLTALDMSGFGLIPSGKYIRIARQRDARDKQLKTYTGDYSPDTDALITRVFPLKYIQAEEVARTFRSFMPANSRIIPYEQTNTVIVTDTGSNIAKLGKMLEILDVEGYDAGIEVIPVRFASAVELAKLVDNLIPGTPAGGGGQPPGAGRFGGGRFTARRTKEGGIINTIIADERTNTLIVHANGKGADQVRELVTKLDLNKPATAGGGKVHVVYLQFAEAEAVANTLNNISTAKIGPASGGGGGAPTGGTGVNPVTASLFEGSIKISPDKSTNALVVTASPADFVTVQRVINRLDIPRDEVYVEVVIMEVSMEGGFNWSSNVANPGGKPPVALITNSQDLVGYATNPLGQQGMLLGFGGGGTVDLPVGGTTVKVASVTGLIKALQTNSQGNVLAMPQIIALDNTEALFESNENVPVPSSTAVQGAGVQTSFSKQQIPLSIKLTPQINKLSNYVKLKIETKLSDLSTRIPTELQGQAFATLDRTVNTTVVVGDSDTVVLGGLTRDKLNTTIRKIPILGDIPLLGWLFKSKTDEYAKTNLLIFLTPHIVRQYEKVRAILDKKLKERDEYIETQVGGTDRLRPYRDNMIRGLPDLKEITKKRDTTVTIGDDGEEITEPTDPFTGGKKPVMTDQGSPVTTPPPAATPVNPGAPQPPGTFAPPPPPAFQPPPDQFGAPPAFDPNATIPPPPTQPFEGVPPS